MDDGFFGIFLRMLDNLLPQKFNEWLYRQKKLVQGILIILMRSIAFIVFLVIALLIYIVFLWVIEILRG